MAWIVGDYTVEAHGSYASAVATDKTKTSYSAIPVTVTYQGTTLYVRDLYECFRNCKNLVTPPSLPSGATNLMNAFMDCENLTSAPQIPSGVTNLSGTFWGCKKITTPPSIPSSVTSMFSTFNQCTSLATAPTIPNSVTDLTQCFYGTAITTPPSIPSSVTNIYNTFAYCTNLEYAPQIPSSVTDIRQCFWGCKKITTPPTIPSSVTVMYSAFQGCSSLTTPPNIPSGVTDLHQCFHGCTSLATAPTIPSNVTNMQSCFVNCTSLTTPPSIPSSVTNMYGTFSGCTNLEYAPTIPSSVTSMQACFVNCTSLETAPSIPSSVTNLKNCFKGCTSLTGNITVNSTPTEYTDIFVNTVSVIYIVNGGSASASTWRTIASGYQNVHYEADDNPLPTVNSFSVKRVASSGSTTPSTTGAWAYVEALVTVYETLLPTGWVASLKSRSLLDNGTAVSPTWQPSSITSYPVTTYCWVDIGDLAKHTLSFSFADAITSEGVEKRSSTSAIITAIIAKAYALVDYYHDDNTGTEGMAIGKLAEDADLLDVAMPTLFRDDLTAQDMTQQEIDDFVDNIGGGGSPIADKVIEQGTSGIWTYRKWNSGVAECWGVTASRSVTTNEIFGSVYYTGISPIATFPSGLFVSTPSVTATRNEDGSGFGLLSLFSINSTSFSGFIVNSLNQTLSMSFGIHAIGRWK